MLCTSPGLTTGHFSPALGLAAMSPGEERYLRAACPKPCTAAVVHTYLYFSSSGLAAMLPMYLSMVCAATLKRSAPAPSPEAFFIASSVLRTWSMTEGGKGEGGQLHAYHLVND